MTLFMLLVFVVLHAPNAVKNVEEKVILDTNVIFIIVNTSDKC